MHIALIEPQIPPNTGNVARLCAATGVSLHLVRPLGFHLTDRYLKRAGLDYWEWVDMRLHDSLESFLGEMSGERLFFFSTRAEKPLWQAEFRSRDCLVFGSETSGLPRRLFAEYPEQFYRIPMANPNVRSLNLAVSVAVVAYEAFRQTGFLKPGPCVRE